MKLKLIKERTGGGYSYEVLSLVLGPLAAYVMFVLTLSWVANGRGLNTGLSSDVLFWAMIGMLVFIIVITTVVGVLLSDFARNNRSREYVRLALSDEAINKKERCIAGMKYYCVVGVLTVVSIIQLGRLTYYLPFRFSLGLVYAFPVVSFLLLFKIDHMSQRFTTRSVSVVISVILMFIWASLSLINESDIGAAKIINDPDEYEFVISSRCFFPPSATRHFPKIIPKEAKHIQFEFMPSIRDQRGEYIQLRYQLPPEEIQNLYDLYSLKKTVSFFGGSNEEHKKADVAVPTTMFYTSSNSSLEFPEDYEVMSFNIPSKKDERPEAFDWSRYREPANFGVAISLQRGEIVYWADAS